MRIVSGYNRLQQRLVLDSSLLLLYSFFKIMKIFIQN